MRLRKCGCTYSKTVEGLPARTRRWELLAFEPFAALAEQPALKRRELRADVVELRVLLRKLRVLRFRVGLPSAVVIVVARRNQSSVLIIAIVACRSLRARDRNCFVLRAGYAAGRRFEPGSHAA